MTVDQFETLSQLFIVASMYATFGFGFIAGLLL